MSDVHNINYSCILCCKAVHVDCVECTMCKNWIHHKCAKMSKKQLKDVENDDNWPCSVCLNNFPFSNIDDDIVKCLCSDIYWENSFCELMVKYTELYRVKL